MATNETRELGNHSWHGVNRFVGQTTLPAASIGNEEIEESAAIEATKLDHQIELFYSQIVGTDNVDETKLVHVVFGLTGEIVAVHAANQVTAEASDTTTVDVKVNGTTKLDAVITLNAAATTTTTAGSLDTTALVAGDKITVVINATGTAPGEGVWVRIVIRVKAD